MSIKGDVPMLLKSSSWKMKARHHDQRSVRESGVVLVKRKSALHSIMNDGDESIEDGKGQKGAEGVVITTKLLARTARQSHQ